MVSTLRDKSGEWRRLHNEELHGLYRSPNVVRVIKSRKLRWAGHLATKEEGRSSIKVLTDEPTGKSPLGLEDNIRMYLKEKGVSTRNWVEVTKEY